jgi:ribosome biogenesis SPOUT family RNA methylase Rps3
MATKQRSYIIEHMEDDMHAWCLLEYKHMLSNVGPDHLWFSCLSETCKKNMPQDLAQAHCHSEDVLHLPDVDPKLVCLLDPSAQSELAPEDGDTFQYFLFGGILGKE